MASIYESFSIQKVLTQGPLTLKRRFLIVCEKGAGIPSSHAQLYVFIKTTVLFLCSRKRSSAHAFHSHYLDRWLKDLRYNYNGSLVCVAGRGRISRSGLTQDIKMGSCVFQCDVPHRWIAQRQIGPVSVYCDGVGCRVLCLQHGISVWQHIGQSTTATSRHRRDMTSDVSKRR